MPSNAGGARRGAGRKPRSTSPQPGSPFPSGLDLPSLTPESEAPKKTFKEASVEARSLPPTGTPLADLPPHIRNAFGFLARGLTKTKAAGQVNRTVDTLNNWLERYPKALDEAAQQIADPQAALHPFLNKALGELWNILDSPSVEPGTKLSAIREVLDREYGKPNTKEQRDIRQTITIDVVRFGDQKMALSHEIVPAMPLLAEPVEEGMVRELTEEEWDQANRQAEEAELEAAPLAPWLQELEADDDEGEG